MPTKGLLHIKGLSRTEIAKLLEERRKSFPLRVEAHARSVFLQREIRQRMMQHLREAEQHHIGQNMSPMGMHDEHPTRARRDLLIASLAQRPWRPKSDLEQNEPNGQACRRTAAQAQRDYFTTK